MSRPPPNTTPNSKPREMSLPVHPFPPLPKPPTQTSIGHASPYNPPLPRTYDTPSSADQYRPALPPPFPAHTPIGYGPGRGPSTGYRAGVVPGGAGPIRSGSGSFQNPYDPIPTPSGPSHNPYRPLTIPNHPPQPQPLNQDRRSSSIFPDLNPGGIEGGLVQSPEEEEEDMDAGEDSVNGDEDNKGPGAGGGSGRAGGGGMGQGVKKRRPHATRRRVVQSCSECRRRKIKCDKKFPCGPCVLRGDQSRCHEVGMAEKNVNASPSTFATASDLALVAHRLDVLESALIKAGTLSTAELDQQLKYGRPNPIMALHGGVDIDSDNRGAEVVKVERGLGLSEAGGVRFVDEPNSRTQGQQITPDRPPAARKTDDHAGRPAPIEDDPDLDVNDDTEGAALTLEHLAFGRSRADGAHALPHFGGRGQSSISKFAPNNDYHLAKTLPHPHPHHPHRAGSGSPLSTNGRALSITASAGNSPADTRRKSSLNVVSLPPPPPLDPPPLTHHNSAPEPISGQNKYTDSLSNEDRQMRIDALLDLIGPIDVFELVYRKTDVGLKALTKVLPSRETGELLVKTYLEKVDWLYRCLHVPTFLRQCNDLWAIPNDMVVHEIAMPFVALYFSVCCLGMQFMDADEAPKHFTMDEIRDLPDLWFNAARSSMWAADFVGTHTMEHLQSLLLLGVFMNNRDRGEAAWALLGAGIKMAQGLGLSRLGAEPTSAAAKSLPMWTGRWESLIQREVGRRIWWSYVFLDWALAPSYNFSCSIHPDQIKTALPSNVDDEDIIDGQPIRPRPLSVRTGMSFTLARLQFSLIAYRQIMAANTHRHPPYSFILTTDAELRKAMMDLPAFLQPNPSDKSRQPPPTQDPKTLVRYYEKVMLNLAIHSRMLRLHRPWLAKGYTDERFAYSKEQCIRAARASLRMMSDTHGTAAFLEKWWLPLFYVSVSGLVVIIDLLRTNRRDMQSTETEQKINEVKGALGQMRQIADVSHPSRAAVKVMEFLLAEVEERRRPGSSAGTTIGNGTGTGKRKDREEDETDGLQRAVKKLIRQAQLEMDSPEGSSTTIPHTPGSSSLPRHHSSSPFGEHDPAKDRPVFDAYPMPSVPPPPSLPQDNQASNRNPKAPPTTAQIPPQSVKVNPTLGPSTSGNPQMIFNPSNSIPPHLNPSLQPFNASSPFSFTPNQGNLNLDLDLNFPHPTSAPTYATSTPIPQLDPSVEDLLANYFQSPLPQNAQQAQSWGTVPDDFLSRVFSFSWDNNTTLGQPDLQQQQGIGGMYGGQMTQGGQIQQGQAQGQGQGQGGNGAGQGISGQGAGSGLGKSGGGGGGGGDGISGQGTEAFVPFDWGSSGGWMA